MDRVLVIGATGFIGDYLVQYFLEQGSNVLGTSYSRGGSFKSLDIRQAKSVATLVKEYDPSVVINCTNSPTMQGHSGINVDGMRNVLGACSNLGNIPLVGFSTSAVLPGSKDPVDESIPEQCHERYAPYGDTKIQAERMLLEYPCSVILRIGVAYDLDTNHPTRDVLSSALQKETSQNNKQLRSPLFRRDIGPGVGLLVGEERWGLYNFAGPDRITKYQLVGRAIEVLDTGCSLMEKSDEMLPPLPHLNLDTTKAKQAGVTFTSLDGALKIIGEELSQHI